MTPFGAGYYLDEAGNVYAPEPVQEQSDQRGGSPQYSATVRPPNAPPNAVFVNSQDDAAFDALPMGTPVYHERGFVGISETDYALSDAHSP